MDGRARVLRSLALVLVVAGGICAPGTDAQQSVVGGIRGVVVDLEFSVPLSGVRVTVVEAGLTTVTSEQGGFVFDSVERGNYTLSFYKSGYEREVRSQVVVTGGRLVDLRVEMSPEIIDMQEMVVTGADLLGGTEIALLEIRAVNVAMQDAISSEVFKAAGVSDVSQALSLVTGASVVEGKYATVRGLSDRYTGTTLNGLRVPSADPRRRAVQVDQFPTGTVENVTVTKTFTPDLQGDFTGGGVDIQTKSIPEQFFLSFSVSAEHNSEATNEADYLTYAGGGVNVDARGGSARKLSELGQDPPLTKGLTAIVYSNNPSPEDMAAAVAFDDLTRAFQPTMGTSTAQPGLNGSFSVSSGNRFALGDRDVIGILGSLTWTHKYDFYDGGTNNQGGVSDPSQPPAILKPRSDTKGTEEVLLGFLGSFDWQPNDAHDLSLKMVTNRAAEDSARFQVEEVGFPLIEQNQSLQYIERNVGSTQMSGRHDFGVGLPAAERGFSLHWAAASSTTEQNEPDVRFFRNSRDTESNVSTTPSNSTEALNTRRIFRTGAEDNLQSSIDAEFPFERGNRLRGSLKLGIYLDRTDRTYVQDSFTYAFAPQNFGGFFSPGRLCNSSKSFYPAPDADTLWTDVFTSPDRTGLAPEEVVCDFLPGPVPTPAVNQLLWVIQPLDDDVDYTGGQDIDAQYAMVELPLAPKVKLIAGARRERTRLSVAPVSELGNVEVVVVDDDGNRAVLLAPDIQARANIDTRETLPSINLNWEPIPAMKVRGSWSRTIARPTFRELAPVVTEEFIFGDEFLGNSSLTLSEIENRDLRWEWFRRAGEVLAVSYFEKDISDPIELISFSFSERTVIQPINFQTGEVSGFELEARTGLDVIADALSDLSVGFNYTRLESEVDVPQDEQDSLAQFGLDQARRALQGQPEDILNWNVTYDNERSGTTAAVFFNRVGETLLTGAAVGDDGTPNVFSVPYSAWNVTFNQRVREFDGLKLSLGMKIKNLAAPNRRTVYRTPAGEEALKTDRVTARRISLGVSLNW